MCFKYRTLHHTLQRGYYLNVLFYISWCGPYGMAVASQKTRNTKKAKFSSKFPELETFTLLMFWAPIDFDKVCGSSAFLSCNVSKGVRIWFLLPALAHIPGLCFSSCLTKPHLTSWLEIVTLTRCDINSQRLLFHNTFITHIKFFSLGVSTEEAENSRSEVALALFCLRTHCAASGFACGCV